MPKNPLTYDSFINQSGTQTGEYSNGRSGLDKYGPDMIGGKATSLSVPTDLYNPIPTDLDLIPSAHQDAFHHYETLDKTKMNFAAPDYSREIYYPVNHFTEMDD